MSIDIVGEVEDIYMQSLTDKELYNPLDNLRSIEDISSRLLASLRAELKSIPGLEKPRVFLDMDGVIVNFDAYMSKYNLTGDEVKKIPGAYLEMEPYPEALAAIKVLVGSGFDVWLATKPPTGIPYAYSDKAAWVFKHLPELKRKLILTHDKGLLGCERDFLVDDRPHKANCQSFPGTLIPFINGKTWEEVIKEIRD